MGRDQPDNTWWRFVPRNRAVGLFTVVVWPVVLALVVWAIATGEYPTPSGAALEVVILVIDVWCLLRAITGLAALRAGAERVNQGQGPHPRSRNASEDSAR